MHIGRGRCGVLTQRLLSSLHADLHFSIGLASYWGEEEERNGGIDHTLLSLSFIAYKELTQLPCNTHWLIDIYSVYCLLFCWLHVNRGIEQQLLYFADMTIKFLLSLRSIAHIITTATKDSVNYCSWNSSRTIISIYDLHSISQWNGMVTSWLLRK